MKVKVKVKLDVVRCCLAGVPADGGTSGREVDVIPLPEAIEKAMWAAWGGCRGQGSGEWKEEERSWLRHYMMQHGWTEAQFYNAGPAP